MEDHDESADEIKPYMFEPMPNENTANSDSLGSNTGSSDASEDEVDKEFEAINHWRLSTMDWCKCAI